MAVVAGILLAAFMVGFVYLLVRLFLVGLVMLRGLWQLEKRHPGIVARSLPPPQPSRPPWLGAGFLIGHWWHR
jgi:hypothetical protein